MAAADLATRPQQERSSRRKPFTQWVKNLTSLKGKSGDQQDKANGRLAGKKTGTLRGKKGSTLKNNPYPQSGAYLQQRDQSPASSANGALSTASPTSRPPLESRSFESLPASTAQERETKSTSNRSGGPTKPETVHSDAGHSKAATTTTHGGTISDGVGNDSTFSSPSQSQHSLTTTLTTIQSTSAGNTLNNASGYNPNPHHHGSLNNPNPVMFSHQYPVSPAPSNPNTISAIPRHMTDQPNTYDRATANGLLTDNASIMTLASSSKRRRRSYESQTDASVRALAPSSVWGGSRESLPLSVLSGNADREPPTGSIHFSHSRPSIGGIAPAERASVYSSSGVAAPALASERNSSYSHSHKPTKDLADAKSLRSITNIDARSTHGDTKSIHTMDGKADARSLGDVASLKNYEGSVRSGAIGHGRQDSIPGSIGSPVATSTGMRHPSAGGAMSRQSSDWQYADKEDGGGGDDREEKDLDAPVDGNETHNVGVDGTNKIEEAKR